METQLPPLLPRAGLSPQRTVLVCEPPTPSGPGCSAPSRVWVASSRDPASPCFCLPRPPRTPRARLGLQVSSRGGCLLSGSVWGRLGDSDTPRCPGLGLCAEPLASSADASQVCHEGVFWAPLEGWACQPSRQGGPWGGLWASGCGHGSERWSVFLSGVGHAGSHETDGSEGAGVGCGHEARAWVWGRQGRNWTGGFRRGWVGRGGGTVLDVN